MTLPHSQRWRLIGCFALGVSIGGFFDGILLHQILQWHHLLSGIADRAADLRFQINADGVFHLAMSCCSLVWALVAAALGQTSVGRCNRHSLHFHGFWRPAPFGRSSFALAAWPAPDHDGQHPLFWDLLRLAVFGSGPLLLGWWSLKRPPPGPSSR
ncbi:DUF2243 domain-containing protein [Sinorhizobium meliloti]|nr:DUF2243 domain-containing protein [Sinorhizobium meliloti]